MKIDRNILSGSFELEINTIKLNKKERRCIVTVKEMSLCDYLKKHKCEIVGNGIFYHYFDSNLREHCVEIAKILLKNGLGLNPKIGELDKELLYIWFESRNRFVQRKIKALKATFGRYVSERKFL
jgi:hypothetical protein